MRIDNSPSLDGDEIGKYVERWDFDVDDETLAAFAEEFQQFNELLTRLEEFEDNSPPERDYKWADDDEDPLGAFITKCDISETDSGRLTDIKVAVKDNIAVAGVPMTCGSKVLESFHPHSDATVVSRLLNAGATIIGKANMDEFAFGGDESTMAYRLARNPNARNHQPGGSSAGSGVAVANGDVGAALGSDTGGSVRFPASWCGVVGVKPTRGLVSLEGFGQFSKTLDTIGPLARDTETAARVLEVISGADPADNLTLGAEMGDYTGSVDRGRAEDLSNLTVGVPDELMGKQEDIDENARAAIDQFADEGANIVSVSIPNYEFILPAWIGVGMTEMGAYMRARGQNYWVDTGARPAYVAALDEGLRTRGKELGNTVRSSVLYADYLNTRLGDEYHSLATRARHLITEEVSSLFEEVDVLASTGVPTLPPEWGVGMDDVFTAMTNTCPFNLTGHPAMCLPCGTVEGLPTSLQIVAPHFQEERLFRVGSTWERLYED